MLFPIFFMFQIIIIIIMFDSTKLDSFYIEFVLPGKGTKSLPFVYNWCTKDC